MTLVSKREHTEQRFPVPLSYHFLLAQNQYNEFVNQILSLYNLDIHNISFFKEIGNVNKEKLYHFGCYIGEIAIEYEDNFVTYKFKKGCC